VARSRREFFETVGAGAAGFAIGMPAAEAAPGGANGPSDDGPVPIAVPDPSPATSESV